MTAPKSIAWLETELKHASAIAAISIGQPDRAENVAYREHIRKQLQDARANVEAFRLLQQSLAHQIANPADPYHWIHHYDPDAGVHGVCGCEGEK